jgi:hypothetical protein
VQNLLGHSSLYVTQLYAHPVDERMRQAVELLVEKPPVQASSPENLAPIWHQSSGEIKPKKQASNSFSWN